MEIQVTSPQRAGRGNRFEGAAIRPVAPVARVVAAAGLAAAAAVYFWLGGAWWLALVLLLAPDLTFLGFAVSARFGVAAYNSAHRPIVPAALIVLALIAGSRVVVLLMLIWIGHIAMDRAAGYGLKQAPAAATPW
jgi:hypothetical protein